MSVTLRGKYITLQPLQEEHFLPLFDAIGCDADVFKWLPYICPTSESEFLAIMSLIFNDSREREAFVVIDNASRRPVGTTSYLDPSGPNMAVEIGGTFYAQSVWRSYVNTEAKLLLLTEGFENRGLERIYFKTNALNERSCNAILRLGAIFEGVLRHHMLMPNGIWRDSAYFSILSAEWPSVKKQLSAKL